MAEAWTYPPTSFFPPLYNLSMKRSFTDYTDDSNSSGSEKYHRAKISRDGSTDAYTSGSSPATSPVSPAYAASPVHVRPPTTPQRRTLHPTRKYTGSSRISDYELQQKLGEGTFGYVRFR